VEFHGQTGRRSRALPLNGRPMYQRIIGAQARFLIPRSKAAQWILFRIRKA